MSSALDLKTKEEKDAELDKRIEALRKKNEALVKRYQEIEEDKKKAEQEGIAVTTPRKPRHHEAEPDRRKTEKENFTVTGDLSKQSGEKKIVNDWKTGVPRGRKTSEESDGHDRPSEGHSPPRRKGTGRVGRGGGQRGGGAGGRQERRDREPRTPRNGEHGESAGQGRRGRRRGGGGLGGGGVTPGGIDRKSKEWEEKRRQNIEKMNAEMERIAEYERGQRSDGDKPNRNFLDDPRRSGPAPDIDRKEGSRRHVRNWGGLDFDNVKTGAELEKEWSSRRPGPKGSVDMTMSMTGRERAEYLRWKKEREQIDEERLARHRNASGQWRREWDAQKTDSMFKEDPCVAPEGITPEQGSRRDDSKRPPKAPTFGEFISQGRTQGPRGDRTRGKTRGQKPSYSMHDNRWEGEKEEEKEKDDNTTQEEKTKEKEEMVEKSKPPTAEEAGENNGDGEEDEDEWEDASDLDNNEVAEEGSDSGSEKKDRGKEKPAKDNSAASPASRSRQASAGSPKEQRTPRPKVHIPSPAPVQESLEGGKPLSPFSPLDSHQPVSDWGEEMEMLSPRSSMGGESPLKPPSVEASPPQKKEQEEEEEKEASRSGEPAESLKEEDADILSPSEKTVIVSETESVPTESATVPPSDSALSEVSEVVGVMDQGAPSQTDEPDSPASPAILAAGQSSSEPTEGKDNNTAETHSSPAETEETTSG